MGQIMNRVRTVAADEGLVGLLKRVVRRLAAPIVRTVRRIVQRPRILKLFVLQLDYKDMAAIPPPIIDLDIAELREKDDADVEAVAAFHFYGHSKDHVMQFLRSGEHCYVARSAGQVVSCYWRATRQYYDHFLKRRFVLADNEEYLLGGFTLPEFRSHGIASYLLYASARERLGRCQDVRGIMLVRTENMASLQSVKKLGFSVCGRVGFIEILGIRFHFLLGRDVLPATRKRNYLAI
ncbi:MAG: hypothetical protein GX113_06440 [Actinobacteria bacterium]|jgi:ribosomal protein S18 acetylase RimI-like enzyme|nr:hypothetical protein [Actinomycetota bacterium]